MARMTLDLANGAGSLTKPAVSANPHRVLHVFGQRCISRPGGGSIPPARWFHTIS
jgi:hypothetical protein